MKKLTKIQEREFLRSVALGNFFKANDKVIITYPAFSDEVAVFTLNNSQFAKFVPQKNVDGTGITSGKKTLKEVTASAASIISERTAAYAIKIEDDVLLNDVYIAASCIGRLKDGDFFGYVEKLVTTVTPLLENPEFSKYGVTADMLTSVSKLADQFKDSFGQAKQADNTGKFASKSINEVIKAIHANIVQFDFLIDFFAKDNSKFVSDYRTAVTIDKSNIRHSGISGIITNSLTGIAIEGAVITGEGKNKVTTSTFGGAYELIKLKNGYMSITITAPGYESQITVVKIENGIIQQLDIAMQASILEMPDIKTA